MRKLTAVYILSIILGSFPVFASINTSSTTEIASSTTETASNINAANCCGRDNHVNGKSYNTHTIWLNRGQACVSISGDGSSDLDLFLYDGYGNRTVSNGGGDDEAVCISIYRSGYFRVDVVNHGRYANDYAIWVN